MKTLSMGLFYSLLLLISLSSFETAMACTKDKLMPGTGCSGGSSGTCKCCPQGYHCKKSSSGIGSKCNCK